MPRRKTRFAVLVHEPQDEHQRPADAQASAVFAFVGPCHDTDEAYALACAQFEEVLIDRDEEGMRFSVVPVLPTPTKRTTTKED